MRGREALDGATALVITADEDVQQLIRDRLKRAGMAVIEAPDGATGLEVARRQPDLVIVDISLPDMDGLAATAALKSDPLTQQIPVIQRSSVAIDQSALADGLSSGADAYLVAPISEELLIATATSLIRYRELSQQLEVALSLDETGVFDWAIPTGKVRWSESLERVHGLPPGGFGGTFDDFVATIHPEDRDRVAAELDVALASSTSIDIAFRFVRADGGHGWMEGRGRIFRDELGEPVRLLGLGHDVTSRVIDRQRVEQLRRLASQFNAARTSKRVLDVLRRELADTNARFALVDRSAPDADGAHFSSAVGDRRLDIFLDGRGSTAIAADQIAAINTLAVGALDRALRYEVERSNAIAMQRALLPASTPDVAGWTVDAKYLPASAVDRLGGDFYDIVRLDDHFVVVLGDVAGHGLDAASQMGMVRTLLRTLAASHDGEPATVLRWARSLFGTVCGEDSPFVTAIIARFGHGDQRVSVASAGHPPPVVHRAGRAAIADVPPAPPLGVKVDCEDRNAVVELAAGDWIAFYSDGVFEDRRRSIDESVVTAVRGLGREITAAGFIESGEANDLNADDRAAVVVRRLADADC